MKRETQLHGAQLGPIQGLTFAECVLLSMRVFSSVALRVAVIMAGMYFMLLDIAKSFELSSLALFVCVLFASTDDTLRPAIPSTFWHENKIKRI